MARNYQSKWRYLRGRILIPDEAIHRSEPVLLHISDTTRMIFGAIEELVHVVQPEYIVHTGDLVDNLKLEIIPGLARQYRVQVQAMLRIVGMAKKRGVIILGNHDLPSLKNRESARMMIRDGVVRETIEGSRFIISHGYSGGEPGAYSLYGHDDTVGQGPLELNGIFHIHVILLRSGKILKLDYPWGTEEQRLLKRKIGL